MVSVFSTRTASWVRLKSVRHCLNPSHSVSYQKNNNYSFHNTYTIHHPFHMHYQSKDYTDIPNNMNVILYHSPLMHVILRRQNIYLFLIRNHKPKVNEEYENYAVKQVSKVLNRKFSYTAVRYGRLLVKKLSFQNPETHYCAQATSPEPAEFSRHSHTLFPYDPF